MLEYIRGFRDGITSLYDHLAAGASAAAAVEAIAEVIVSGEPWTPLLLADAVVEVFWRDPREGYAHGFFAFLSRVSSGQQFLEEIQPDSDKSGAAMRAGPDPARRHIVCTLKTIAHHRTAQWSTRRKR